MGGAREKEGRFIVWHRKRGHSSSRQAQNDLWRKVCEWAVGSDGCCSWPGVLCAGVAAPAKPLVQAKKSSPLSSILPFCADKQRLGERSSWTGDESACCLAARWSERIKARATRGPADSRTRLSVSSAQQLVLFVDGTHRKAVDRVDARLMEYFVARPARAPFGR